MFYIEFCASKCLINCTYKICILTFVNWWKLILGNFFSTNKIACVFFKYFGSNKINFLNKVNSFISLDYFFLFAKKMACVFLKYFVLMKINSFKILIFFHKVNSFISLDYFFLFTKKIACVFLKYFVFNNTNSFIFLDYYFLLTKKIALRLILLDP